MKFLIGRHEKMVRDGIQILGLPKAKNRIRVLKTTRRLYPGCYCDGDLIIFMIGINPRGTAPEKEGKKVVYVHEDVPRQILSRIG